MPAPMSQSNIEELLRNSLKRSLQPFSMGQPATVPESQAAIENNPTALQKFQTGIEALRQPSSTGGGRAPASETLTDDVDISTAIEQNRINLNKRRENLGFLNGLIGTELKRLSETGEEVNLKPLISILDSISGTNFAQAYTPPKNIDERKKQIIDLKKTADSMDAKINDDENQFIGRLVDLKKSASGTDKAFIEATRKTTEAEIKADEAERRRLEAERKGSKEQSIYIRQDQNDFNKALKDPIEKINNIRPLVSGFLTGNPLAINNAGVILARFFGDKGALSDFDVKSWGGSKELFRRAMDYYSRTTEGVPSGLTRRDIAELIHHGLKAQKLVLDRSIERAAEQKYKAGKDFAYNSLNDTIDKLIGADEKATYSFMGGIPDTQALMNQIEGEKTEEGVTSKLKRFILGDKKAPVATTPTAPAPASQSLLNLKRGL